MRVLLVHGPNLNRLGRREPSIYGTMTLDQIVGAVADRALKAGVEVMPFQSNHEGALIDWLQTEDANADAVIVNPGALAHYSVALRDALADTRLPVVEVHISQPTDREPFRQTLVTASVAAKVICGKGLTGYLEALDFVINVVQRGDQSGTSQLSDAVTSHEHERDDRGRSCESRLNGYRGFLMFLVAL